jgi:hypothetical protein
MDVFFKREGFDTIGFEESVWERADGGKYAEDIYVSVHVDDCLIDCKSKDIMVVFKKKILTRFIGTVPSFHSLVCASERSRDL